MTLIDTQCESCGTTLATLDRMWHHFRAKRMAMLCNGCAFPEEQVHHIIDPSTLARYEDACRAFRLLGGSEGT